MEEGKTRTGRLNGGREGLRKGRTEEKTEEEEN